MPRRQFYPHQKYMSAKGIALSELPQELKTLVVEFAETDDQITGYEESLEPTSEDLKEAIQDWYEEEIDNEACPCQVKNKDKPLALIAYIYLEENRDVIPIQELKDKKVKNTFYQNFWGFPKKEVSLKDGFRLEKQKGAPTYKIINENDQPQEQDAQERA